MPDEVNVTVIVQRHGAQTLAIPKDQISDPVQRGKFAHLVILENGMTSGKTSVLFHIKLPDGTSVMTETSAEIFKEVGSIIEKAEEKFRAQKN